MKILTVLTLTGDINTNLNLGLIENGYTYSCTNTATSFDCRATRGACTLLVTDANSTVFSLSSSTCPSIASCTPANAVMSAWVYGACSVSCGGGTQNGTRTVITPAYCGGTTGATTDTQPCNPQACCTPNCSGKVCGSDGCSGSCGTCNDGDSCTDDVCDTGGASCSYPDNGSCCTPNGHECGDDGCGGNYGGCPTGQVCRGDNGMCCTPNGNECGLDGCGQMLPGCNTWETSSGGSCQCQLTCDGSTYCYNATMSSTSGMACNGSSCVNLYEDNNNCGSVGFYCDIYCGFPTSCVNGSCQNFFTINGGMGCHWGP